jgi:hypothetical protein
MKIAGVHDHANKAVRWIDEGDPYSWLRAFEHLGSMGFDVHALLAVNTHGNFASQTARKVNYRFYNEDRSFNSCKQILENIKPDIILLNLCWYGHAEKAVISLRDSLPKSRLIIRLYHDVRYLWNQPGFLSILKLCDIVIAPTRSQACYIKTQGILRPTHVAPFGINRHEIDNFTLQKDRMIDIISFVNSHPARNLDLVHKIYKKLECKGFNVQNQLNLSRKALVQVLNQSKFMLLSSLTEASGSRIMLEAIQAGCSPIAFKECETAVEVLEHHQCGSILETGIKLQMPQKKPIRPFRCAQRLAISIGDILAKAPRPSTDGILQQYDYTQEVKSIVNIMLNL